MSHDNPGKRSEGNKKPEPPKITTEIIVAAGTANPVRRESPNGWGEEYDKLTFDGQPVDITVKVGQYNGVGIRIKEDGTLIITNYGGMYQTYAPQNLRLEPTRPWDAA